MRDIKPVLLGGAIALIIFLATRPAIDFEFVLEWRDDGCTSNSIEIEAGFPDIERILSHEVHCVLILDDYDFFKEQGSYYGITRSIFKTHAEAEPRTEHSVELCCGPANDYYKGWHY